MLADISTLVAGDLTVAAPLHCMVGGGGGGLTEQRVGDGLGGHPLWVCRQGALPAPWGYRRHVAVVEVHGSQVTCPHAFVGGNGRATPLGQ